MFVIKLQTMTQLERVYTIYKLLEENPQTVNEIHSSLLKLKVDIGLRQIYIDIKQISQFILREGEEILISTSQFNRKTFRLVKPSVDLNLNKRDISTFQLTRSASPRILQISRKESMNKFRSVYKNFIKINKTFYAFMSEEQNQHSFFYESLYDENYNTKIDDIIWSIANYKLITINSIEGDATSIPQKIKFPLLLKPILLVYHRGNHFLAGYQNGTDEFITIDIAQISDYVLTQKTFAFKKLVASSKIEILKRFGVTNNIDNTTYSIELEFTDITGNFIKNYYWHANQSFTKNKNGNWLMKFESGINRELIGWIFQWMGNVKIKSPKKLIALYKEQLVIMNNNYAINKPFQYNNQLVQK